MDVNETEENLNNEVTKEQAKEKVRKNFKSSITESIAEQKKQFSDLMGCRIIIEEMLYGKGYYTHFDSEKLYDATIYMSVYDSLYNIAFVKAYESITEAILLSTIKAIINEDSAVLTITDDMARLEKAVKDALESINLLPIKDKAVSMAEGKTIAMVKELYIAEEDPETKHVEGIKALREIISSTYFKNYIHEAYGEEYIKETMTLFLAGKTIKQANSDIVNAYNEQNNGEDVIRETINQAKEDAGNMKEEVEKETEENKKEDDEQSTLKTVGIYAASLAAGVFAGYVIGKAINIAIEKYNESKEDDTEVFDMSAVMDGTMSIIDYAKDTTSNVVTSISDGKDIFADSVNDDIFKI